MFTITASFFFLTTLNKHIGTYVILIVEGLLLKNLLDMLSGVSVLEFTAQFQWETGLPTICTLKPI